MNLVVVFEVPPPSTPQQLAHRLDRMNEVLSTAWDHQSTDLSIAIEMTDSLTLDTVVRAVQETAPGARPRFTPEASDRLKAALRRSDEQVGRDVGRADAASDAVPHDRCATRP